ncbi:DNA-binding protein [Sphingobacterium sp. DR205]|uniref:DNA-binding protein n=1 Tax=Sphingobacterium sp. DR205 TaxID=2713573 RepID=UPI0013E42760|nr:DNA-binding protein [Sphingobacterium sp. DR205]QIH34612.1 DNA-binding protein [Sphingobacterium sp. DR205]
MQTLELLTKADLAQFKIQLLKEIEKLLDEKMTVIPNTNNSDVEWIRSKVARQFMNISAGTLQNLRITGKIQFKKVLGSYYYNFPDLKNLFENGKA